MEISSDARARIAVGVDHAARELAAVLQHLDDPNAVWLDLDVVSARILEIADVLTDEGYPDPKLSP